MDILVAPGREGARVDDIGPLAARLRRASGRDIHVVPAEHVTLLNVTLPLRSNRQRIAALPFAVEDRLAAPLEDLHVALCGHGPDGGIVAAALARDVMADAARDQPDLAILPEQLALPVPPPIGDGPPAWLVFRHGARVVVRLADGTGFAARATALPELWLRAGRPVVKSLGEALPDGIDWTQGKDVPPSQADLSVDMRQGAFRPPSGWVRPLRAVAAALPVVALLHLALAWADLQVLRGLALDARVETEAALAEKVPSATVFDDPGMLWSRLSARDDDGPGDGGPVPLLDRASGTLMSAELAVTVDRLVWSTAPDTLALSITAPTLDVLQQTEEALRLAGLAVTAGTATAGEAGAQSELTIRDGDGG
ncbi:GspL cytoplasmic actin-ATPase-like region [Roseivivax jejudonensis]|uniref:GspL cytoplasmic actin-ATPase-like region n=1 Tax=Roseivivax jejudonensis TaxID=1529041 RepID=A0A1X6Y7G1_9RHOB|nr:type II secretion system protein GspL [Roseivivax jejudonensis]SLN12984.1 GspL cytoplasmic actin-ATPase-like region [Roseivivax jejudonensis]